MLLRRTVGRSLSASLWFRMQSTLAPPPPGFSPHTERNATILLPVQDKPFLNPIQEFNRDVSVAVIKQWAKVRDQEARKKWEIKRANKNKGKETEPSVTVEQPTDETAVNSSDAVPTGSETKPKRDRNAYVSPKVNIIEALSATGLRSIRYAQEIPGVK